MDRDPTPATPHGSEPVVSVRGLTKRFGPVVACDAIDLDLRAGEIHGILGENGAGKSTLLRLIAGVEVPDAGTVQFQGARPGSSRIGGRRRPEIGMVHQHYSLVGALTVWENVTLGAPGRLEPELVRSRIEEVADRYGLAVDPAALVRDLDVAARQRVEIVKCLVHEPRVLLLDEPGASLAPQDSEALLAVLREGVRRDGWAVALVSHRLDEVLAVTDTISVLRDGAVVARVDTSDADVGTLATAMLGRRPEAVVPPRVRHPAADPPALRVDSARIVEPDGRIALDGLSLEVGVGEIVGVAGVDGNGQLAVSRVLSSLVRLDAGTVSIGGVAVAPGIPGAMQRAGVAVIPADRHESGCVLDMTVAENLLLGSLETVSSRHGLLDRSAMTRRATRLMEEFDIRAEGPDTPLRQLSGGNQQRVVLARALSGSPRVVVAHQPTRGLDPEAVVAVRDRLRAAAVAGTGVVIMSDDLDELEDLADRMLVVARGRIVGEVAGPGFDRDRIGRLMGGSVQP